MESNVKQSRPKTKTSEVEPLSYISRTFPSDNQDERATSGQGQTFKIQLKDEKKHLFLCICGEINLY